MEVGSPAADLRQICSPYSVLAGATFAYRASRFRWMHTIACAVNKRWASPARCYMTDEGVVSSCVPSFIQYAIPAVRCRLVCAVCFRLYPHLNGAASYGYIVWWLCVASRPSGSASRLCCLLALLGDLAGLLGCPTVALCDV